ncbi:Protein SRG1 [Dichanthelium oligosanthes]|uniref:Protein SRG1 n=1 Tax=Dichanthelium oligosanthes TaxID=888268 RepID=A0A1E5UP04_9POAL|nr:Protein SRG1 [Dichanthelium oligosanthes]
METANNKIVHRDEITDDAFTDSVQIAEKYIPTEEVSAGAVVGVDDEAYDYELPFVDMARLLDPELSASETAKLGSACRDWGFFQLTNHGIDEAVIQRYGHNYSRLSKLDWAESVILNTQPVQDRNMELWPSPMFRNALEDYSAEVTNLMWQLLGSMAADLGVGREALLGAFSGKRQSMAIHHYPPCRHPDKVIGNTAHTDGLGLTVLLHVDDTPGLQMLRGGWWFPVRPLPGALVVNVSDILHILTNGAYRSVEHRGGCQRRAGPDHRRDIPGRLRRRDGDAVPGAARSWWRGMVVNAERGRTTAVIFQDASVGGMVTPLPELLVHGGEARYKSIPRFEYLKVRFSALAKRTGFLESLKL